MCIGRLHGITKREFVSHPAGRPGRSYDELVSELSRIGVAIDTELLRRFDGLIEERGYTNRSEAFRDLIRRELVERAWEGPDSEVVGTVTLVYDHHVRLLNEKLTEMQHQHHRSILSTLHVHLDHDNCLEVLVVRGRASVVQRVADALISTKGVKHGRLTITTSGAELG
jgi:CopG family nickel-responsive transcriptional regulator